MQTIRTNLAIVAPTQYSNFPHTSLFVFNGVVLGAGPSGLSRACCATTDNGQPINAYFEPITSNLGHIGRTRLRYLYLELKSSRDLEIDITIDGVAQRTIPVPATEDRMVYVRVGVGRDLSGNFWNFRIRNTGGGTFSINTIKCLPQYLHKGRK